MTISTWTPISTAVALIGAVTTHRNCQPHNRYQLSARLSRPKGGADTAGEGARWSAGVCTPRCRASTTARSGPASTSGRRRPTPCAPDADVSIHADGGPPSGLGFHVNYSAPPLNDAQSGGSVQLATAMRDSLVAAGVAPATYVGSNGPYGRADLAGLNLAEYPAVLVETGNMRIAVEAAVMESPEGRQRYADAITAGIVAYLTQKQ